MPDHDHTDPYHHQATRDRSLLLAAAAIIHTAATAKSQPQWHSIADRLTEMAPPAHDTQETP